MGQRGVARAFLWVFCVALPVVGAPRAWPGQEDADREVTSARTAYRADLEAQPEGRLALEGFGFLEAGDLERAAEAFQSALSFREAFAPAHYGLGLTSFRKGLQAGEGGAFAGRAAYHAEQAAALRPGPAAPYRLLGRIYAELFGDDERAMDICIRFLADSPSADPDLLGVLASAYTRTDAFARLCEGIVGNAPDPQQRADRLLLAAFACADRGGFKPAMQYFGLYLALLPVEEREFYRDITPILPVEERRAFERTKGEEAERRVFRTRFWAARDPDLLTPVNERQFEHFRRVWYARAHFSQAAHPWDRRGEVYIRYGPPDYRSQSGEQAAPMSLAVQRIKEHVGFALSGEEGVGAVSEGPAFPVAAQHPVPWESWVYTQVAGGIEVVFTDAWGRGRFDFAQAPPAHPSDPGAIHLQARLAAYAPETVMKRSIEQMPDYYAPAAPGEMLNFYYDCAAFRGADGKTRVEVYYGLPVRNLPGRAGGDTLGKVGYAVSLIDPAGEEVLQEVELAAYCANGPVAWQRDLLIPHQLTVEARPGTYALRVQVKDLVSGRFGIYRGRLEVDDYTGGELGVSDLQLGWQFVASGGVGRYKKDGEMWVTPMAPRRYPKGRNILAYFEVYNLAKDAFGQTRFQLKYTIRSEPDRTGPGRLLAGVGRLFTGKREPEVSVLVEQARAGGDQKEFCELSLEHVKPGLNRLTLTVTDLNRGASVQKDALFRYDE